MKINTEQYLSKFKIHYPKSLFPLTPDQITYSLQSFRCPVCQRKLYWRADRRIAYCKSKQKDGFIVKAETLDKYLGI